MVYRGKLIDVRSLKGVAAWIVRELRNYMNKLLQLPEVGGLRALAKY